MSKKPEKPKAAQPQKAPPLPPVAAGARQPAGELGVAEGVLPDGRPFEASLWRNAEQEETVLLTFPVGADADWEAEQILQQVIDAGLVLPVAPALAFYECEQEESFDNPEELLWWVDILLRDAATEWARLGFAVHQPAPEDD